VLNMHHIPCGRYDTLPMLQHQAAHKVEDEKEMAARIERNCSGICSYFAKKIQTKNTVFKKWCRLCNLHLVSRYWRCPCCHAPLSSS
jgi:rubrerythrin